MRKKLLALVMCATMVLGSTITAFADDTSDAVWKIQNKNDKKFDGEVSANGVNGTVKDTVSFTVNDNGVLKVKTVTVCYKADGTPVVMYKDDHGDLQPATKVTNLGTVAETTENGSTTLTAIKNAYAAKDTSATSGNAAVTVQTVAGAKTTYYYDGTTAKEAKYVDGTSNYVNVKDGSFTKLSGNDKLLSATDISFGKVWTTVSVLSTTEESAMEATLYDAVKNGKVSDKAFAIKLTPFVQESTIKTQDLDGVLDKDGKTVKVAKIYSQFSNFMGGEFKLDADLISQTTLKDAAAINVFKYTGYDAEYSTVLQSVVPGLVKVGTVGVDKTFTFSNISTLTGIFVFDEGSVEAINDGVADEKPASDSTSSPKTGDVAPIAALAVVMMGAFGAMVVASKKRA